MHDPFAFRLTPGLRTRISATITHWKTAPNPKRSVNGFATSSSRQSPLSSYGVCCACMFCRWLPVIPKSRRQLSHAARECGMPAVENRKLNAEPSANRGAWLTNSVRARYLPGEADISHFEILSAFLVNRAAAFKGRKPAILPQRDRSQAIAISPTHLHGPTRRSLFGVQFSESPFVHALSVDSLVDLSGPSAGGYYIEAGRFPALVRRSIPRATAPPGWKNCEKQACVASATINTRRGAIRAVLR